MTEQCFHMTAGGRCIFHMGHNGPHYAPTDGRDHSDEIRIRILRDRAEKAEAEVARLQGTPQLLVRVRDWLSKELEIMERSFLPEPNEDESEELTDLRSLLEEIEVVLQKVPR